MPSFIRSLDELSDFLVARKLRPRRRGDELFLEIRTAAGALREITVKQTPDLFDLRTVIPLGLSSGRQAALDLAIADINARIPFPGLHRTTTGNALYVFRIFLNHDDTVDPQVVIDGIATVAHVLETHEPVLARAAAEVPRG